MWEVLKAHAADSWAFIKDRETIPQKQVGQALDKWWVVAAGVGEAGDAILGIPTGLFTELVLLIVAIRRWFEALVI